MTTVGVGRFGSKVGKCTMVTVGVMVGVIVGVEVIVGVKVIVGVGVLAGVFVGGGFKKGMPEHACSKIADAITK